MTLEKLVINGFKSFAESTEFTFDHEFTAIVGPNGSGKTNVADALRWVMGEQSLKLMRMKKATDSIFAGSDKRARLGMAQVDLHINNEDGRLNLDYDHVVISRRLTRKGDTEYMINKTKVRLQDIILLLAQANFGQKSYGVIGQGMITDIVNASPQDRKEFFDEATGVKEFQIKRDQAINKLIRTEDNLERVEDLLVEIEPRLNSLKRQVNKLEKRKKVEEELSEIQVQYYGSATVELNNKLENLTGRGSQLRAEQSTVSDTLASIETEIDGIGKQESRTDIYHRLQKEFDEVLQKKNALLKDQAIIKGRLEVEHERSGEIDLLWMQRRLDDVLQQIDSLQRDLENSKQSVEHQSKQLSSIQSTQKDVGKDYDRIEKQLEQTKQELVKLTDVLSVPEIKHRLEMLFQQQEQFLRELLATTSLSQFQQMQKSAQSVTTKLAELLDELHEERDEDIAIKRQEIKAFEEQWKTTLGLKEKLLHDSAELSAGIKARQETIGIIEKNIEDLQKESKGIIEEMKSKSEASKVKKDKDTQMAALQDESAGLEKQLRDLETQLLTKKSSLDEFNQEEEGKKQRLLELQTKARQTQSQLNQLNNKLQVIEIEIAKLETRREDVKEEISREVTAETQAKIEQWKEERDDQDELLVQIEKLKHQLDLIGGIDTEIIQEYEQTKERFEFLRDQSKDLHETIKSMDGIIDDLDNTIKRQFNKSFKSIAKSFERYFKVLFDGGEAKLSMLTEETIQKDEEEVGEAVKNLELVDKKKQVIGHNPIGKLKKKQRVVSGIDIVAQPPKKKLQSIQALSGGEKSMTAIALICAIIDANAPPFVVLDEVEAALDEANSDKFAAIVRQLSSQTQFVIITHNRSTMHQADVLYGVTMSNDGTSHILSVKMTEAEKMLQADEEAVVA